MAGILSFPEKLKEAREKFFSEEIGIVEGYLEKLLEYAGIATPQTNDGLICCIVSKFCPAYKKAIISQKPQMEVFMPWFETYVKPKILNLLKLETETASCDCPGEYDCNCPDTIVYYKLYFKPK
jgi:hypothetical protein